MNAVARLMMVLAMFVVPASGVWAEPGSASNACVSDQDRVEAWMGEMCDCSCEAQKTNWTARCDLVCAMDWYACRAPRLSDDEVWARFMKGFEDYTADDMARMEHGMSEMRSNPDEMERLRQGQLLEDGAAWDIERSCLKF